jgi:hypothetical protein
MHAKAVDGSLLMGIDVVGMIKPSTLDRSNEMGGWSPFYDPSEPVCHFKICNMTKYFISP